MARGAIVIVDDGRKLGFHSWHLMPKAAICDPELTLGLPPALTAATGMDAIAHCMETFMAPAFNPPADGIALDGLARAWQHIERATKDGSDWILNGSKIFITNAGEAEIYVVLARSDKSAETRKRTPGSCRRAASRRR